MSRVGKYPVEIPAGVQVAIADRVLTAKGKLGELTLPLSDHVDATVEEGRVTVTPRGNAAQARMMWGTTRALVANMVEGRVRRLRKTMEITGHRLPRRGAGQEPGDQPRLLARRGLSGARGHHDHHAAPDRHHRDGHRQAPGRPGRRRDPRYRPPEPYKGKGVRYDNEVIRRKEGKKK